MTYQSRESAQRSLDQVPEALRRLCDNFKTYLMDIRARLARAPATPFITEQTTLEDGMTYLTKLTNLINRRNRFLGRRKISLEELTRIVLRDLISTEMPGWRLKRSLPHMEEALIATGQIADNSERIHQSNLEQAMVALKELGTRELLLRQRAPLVRALEAEYERKLRLREANDLSLSEWEEVESWWEGQREWIQEVREIEALHEMAILELLRLVSVLGEEIPRQMLITEFFF